ncbi:MAG: GNAT family N-acetyltransferase [Rubrivivax sp.]|nr:GNAT family N-acetyltransferase [Rubrivivax sp.]
MTHNPPATAADPKAGGSVRRWVPIRRLHEGHRAKVLRHLLALDGDDRVWRFGQRISDERVARYVDQIDFEHDHVFGTFDRKLELLTLGHLALDRAGGTGEFGVSVLARARGRGLGTQLFEHAVTHARNRGLQTLFLHLARDNTPMLAIVQRASAVIDFEGSDAMAELTLRDDTLGSRLEELLGYQAAAIDFRIKRHALRLDALAPAHPPAS